MLWKYLFKPLLALVIAAVIAIAVAIGLNQPPILEQPGIGVRLWTYLSSNQAATADISGFPELRTRSYWKPQEEVFKQALSVAERLQWKIESVDEANWSFRAVAPTRLWNFEDIVEVAVYSGERGDSRIRMRSQSQFGSADFGGNAHRIVKFHELLEWRL